MLSNSRLFKLDFIIFLFLSLVGKYINATDLTVLLCSFRNHQLPNTTTGCSKETGKKMKIFHLILILVFSVKYLDAGSPGFYPSVDLPPSQDMRAIEDPIVKPEEGEVKSVYEALTVGDIDEVIKRAEEIREHVENNVEARLKLEQVAHDIFDNMNENC